MYLGGDHAHDEAAGLLRLDAGLGQRALVLEHLAGADELHGGRVARARGGDLGLEGGEAGEEGKGRK